MRLAVRTGALVLSIGAGAGSAVAQDALLAARRGLVEDFAQVVAGTQVCPRYQPNATLLGLLALRYGLRFDDPVVEARLEERAAFHAARIKGRSEADICAALLRLFGPEGSNVKNLVRAAP
ncbi:hypothetical protein [Enterovirga rhinocerotis]|nr:hypothetical protein [Enterovirga rhinocerotis]